MCNFIFLVQLDTKYHYYCCMPFRSNNTCIQICDANYLGNCKVGMELLIYISRLIIDNHINTNISSQPCINNQAGTWILNRTSDGWANKPCLASTSKFFNSWTQVIKHGKWVMFSFDHLSLANLQKTIWRVAVQAVKHRLLLVEKTNKRELHKLCLVLSQWFCISVALPINSVDVVIWPPNPRSTLKWIALSCIDSIDWEPFSCFQPMAEPHWTRLVVEIKAPVLIKPDPVLQSARLDHPLWHSIDRSASFTITYNPSPLVLLCYVGEPAIILTWSIKTCEIPTFP